MRPWLWLAVAVSVRGVRSAVAAKNSKRRGRDGCRGLALNSNEAGETEQLIRLRGVIYLVASAAVFKCAQVHVAARRWGKGDGAGALVELEVTGRADE